MTPLIGRAEARRGLLSSAMERSPISYRDGNEVIRPTNPCILTRYGKTTETNCGDSAGWMGIPRRHERERHRAGPETSVCRTAQEISQHFDSYVRSICGIARGANGQQRSRAHEHGRGTDRAHGHHTDRPADREQTIAKRAAVSASDGARGSAATAFSRIAKRWRRTLAHPALVCAAGDGQE